LAALRSHYGRHPEGPRFSPVGRGISVAGSPFPDLHFL
jgi:hypothetical protein